jgi:hypothetical protein
MANFWNAFAQQVGTGDQIKDYQHAARTFVDGLYRLSPKHQTLFHVFIDVNPAIAEIDRNSQIELGLMAKQADLPKMSIQTKTLNAYNRKNIIQERINYDPVTLVFNDDSANVVRNFWYDYYKYYYRDSDHELSLYNQDHKYKARQEQNWGYSPATTSSSPYINSIRIYSLHQKKFSSYILIRPTITSFQHGQHNSGEYTPMEHSMTVAYEAVQYESGPVSNQTVLGFNEIHYDNSPSPLSSLGGGTRSILGAGGLVEGSGDVVTNLKNGNFLGAALGGLRTAKNFKNVSLSQVASGEFSQLGRNILRGQNPLSSIFVPTASSVKDGLARASANSTNNQ